MTDNEKFGLVKPADPAEVKRMEAEKKEEARKRREAKKAQAERARKQAERQKTATPLGRALSQALKGKKLKRG